MKLGEASVVSAADGAVDSIVLRLPSSIGEADVESFLELLFMRGEVQFRVGVKFAMRPRELGKIDSKLGPCEWLPDLHGPADHLVEMSDRVAERELDAAISAGAASAEIERLKRVLSRVRAKSIFGLADVLSARRVEVGLEYQILVRYRRTRALAFREFLRSNVGKHLVLVVDGGVESSLGITGWEQFSGELLLGGGGGSGFSARRATLLAEIMNSQRLLPVRPSVVRVEWPKK